MKNIFLAFPLCLFVFTACGDLDGLQSNKKKNNYDPQVLEKARSERCSSIGKLEEDSASTTGNFQDLAAKSSVFGISTGNDEPCALTDNVTRDFPHSGGTMSFDFLPHTRCVKNNSLWSVFSSETRGGKHYFILKSYDSETIPNIDMSGSVGLSATVARDLTHLKVLVCR